MELKNLDAKQLKRFISEASAVLNRRQKIEQAMNEIRRIVKKYSKDELTFILGSFESSTTTSTGKSRSTRKKVSPKYQSQDGSKKWTGRGRTPSWVVDVCQEKRISLASFKADPQFLI